MKTVIMVVACVIVAVSQTFILLGFLKKLKRIEADFWGASADRARDELEQAREAEREKAAEASHEESE